MSFLNKIFGEADAAFLKEARNTVAKINSLESDVKKLTDGDFPQKTAELKDRLAKGETLDALLPEAFALVREAAMRTLGQRHYDVQLIGALALHSGKIAEMKTGEGKTLVATPAVYLNALTGKGVHVVTVNDYLSSRDAVWMGQIFSFLGLTVGVINSNNVSFVYNPQTDANAVEDKERDELGSFKVVHEYLKSCRRVEAYAADITYGTNNEFGFDYLHDNRATYLSETVQRQHHYAVVDEIDSILIDEARTPLIIAAPTAESDDFYKKFYVIARQLEKEKDYTVDEKLKAISLTQEGIARAEEMLGIENIYTEKGVKYVHHLETAVRAQALFMKDREYVVKDNEVIIVDTFTGRLQPGRRWSEGLHQAVEAKEGVHIQKETRAVASITFQNYFRMYEKLSGMTGTAKTSEEEFRKIYNLDVISIPTNKGIQRIDHSDLIFQTEKGKFIAVARRVKEIHKRGQPVLIGTVSIEKNELLSAYLNQAGIPHTMLNAKNHEKEGEIIAQAGRTGGVTIATNMAGRGVDILLGGNPQAKEEYEKVKNLGGLFVLGTERHEARRIDNQLRGRAGRQGDAGETQFFVSLEDDLMRVFGGDGVKNIMKKLGVPEDMPIENRMVSRGLENAQEKIEGFNFDSRKHTLEYDDVMNHHRKIVYARRRAMLVGDKEKVKEFLDKLVEENPELADLVKEKSVKIGDDAFLEGARKIILYANDELWVEHLEDMEYARSSVNLRAYGQREPLIEYKKEAIRLFRDMEHALNMQVIELLKNMDNSVSQQEIPVQKIDVAIPSDVGRNDFCPCGSGKKYKKCHGQLS